MNKCLWINGLPIENISATEFLNEFVAAFLMPYLAWSRLHLLELVFLWRCFVPCPAGTRLWLLADWVAFGILFGLLCQKRKGLPLFISCQGALCVAVISVTCNLVPVLDGEAVFNSSALSLEKHEHFEEYSVWSLLQLKSVVRCTRCISCYTGHPWVWVFLPCKLIVHGEQPQVCQSSAHWSVSGSCVTRICWCGCCSASLVMSRCLHASPPLHRQHLNHLQAIVWSSECFCATQISPSQDSDWRDFSALV